MHDWQGLDESGKYLDESYVWRYFLHTAWALLCPCFFPFTSSISILLLMSDLDVSLSDLHTCTPPIIHRDVKPKNLLIDSADNILLSVSAL